MTIGSLQISISDGGQHLVVAASGEVDSQSAPELRDTIVAAYLADGRDVVLDLGGVTFIDSSGLSALVAAHRRLAADHAHLAARAARPGVARVLKVTGLDELLAMAPLAPTSQQPMEAPPLV